MQKTIRRAQQQLPSILVLSRVDEWWETMENSVSHLLKSILEDFHAGLPLLIIVTCVELPQPVTKSMYSSYTIFTLIPIPIV